MEIKKVLEKLCLTPAPTGYEREAAAVFKKELEPFVDRIEIDRAGNVIGTLEGMDPKAPTIMVYAHLDTLGFMVRRIEENGYVQVDRVGGIPEKILPALHVLIRTIDGGFVPAVIGTKSHHAAGADEKYKVDPVTSLFFDLGADSKQEVLDMGVDIGCPVIYTPHFELLGKTKVCGTAIDNRGGLAAILKAASLYAGSRSASKICFVGTVWEEYNIRGAVFAARKIKADISLCLDVALASDMPCLSGHLDCRLGKGPALALYSFHGRGTLNGTIPHEGLVKLATACAKEEKIPIQRFAALGYLTDSAYVQMENQYVACLDLGFPTRYTHSPIEICDLYDLENLAKLVKALTSHIDAGFDLHRYSV